MKIISPVFFMAFSFFIIGCSSPNSNGLSPNMIMSSYEEERHPINAYELKMQLLDKECATPTQYLSANINQNTNGNIITVKGQLTNKATLATFKSINIQLRFLDAAHTQVQEEIMTVQEFVNPNSNLTFTHEFETKLKQVTQVDWYILSAECN